MGNNYWTGCWNADASSLQERIFKSFRMSALSCTPKLRPNEKSLSGIFEYWKRFGSINLIQSVYVCVELWVNRMRRELRPHGLKRNVLFPSVRKPWEQFYKQIKQNELNCLCKCMLAVLMRGKSWGKLITADHPRQTFSKRKSDLAQLDNHIHHCLCIVIQQRLGLQAKSKYFPKSTLSNQTCWIWLKKSMDIWKLWEYITSQKF